MGGSIEPSISKEVEIEGARAVHGLDHCHQAPIIAVGAEDANEWLRATLFRVQRGTNQSSSIPH
jgi:hypothetical protein